MPSNRQSGFTLLELMVTVGVLGILTAIAYPSMRDFMRRNRVIAQSNGIQADLQLARGQAAATRSYVSICPLATAGTTSCDMSGKAYDNGWIVYLATTPNATYDNTATNLQRVAPAATNISIRGTTGGVLTFNARGDLLVAGVASTSATFRTCFLVSGATLGTSTNAVPGVQLDVANSGRITSNVLAAGTTCAP